MAELGVLECATGTWLQRLHCKEKLPPSGTLEMLRRREVSSRQRAEALADAERRCAVLAQERLDEERRLGSWRLAAHSEAQQALQVERKLRVDAEAALTQAVAEQRCAQQALASEVQLREEAEKAHAAAVLDIEELRKLVEDDTSLRVIDEFREKCELQRNEIASLHQRLEVQGKGVQDLQNALQQLQQDKLCAHKQWVCERESISRQRELLACERNLALHERDQLKHELRQLREAGTELQASAEAALTAYTAHMTAANSSRASEAAAREVAQELSAPGAAVGTKASSHEADPSSAELQIATEDLLSALGSFLQAHPTGMAVSAPVLPSQEVAADFGGSLAWPDMYQTLHALSGELAVGDSVQVGLPW